MRKLTLFIILALLVTSAVYLFFFRDSKEPLIETSEGESVLKETVPKTKNVISVTSVTVEAKIGETVEAFGESITPLEVLEDSRCPVDAQCVRAGTVRIRANLVSGSGVSDEIFKLGEAVTTEVNSFKLIAVEPKNRVGETTPKGDYIFTFEVTRR